MTIADDLQHILDEYPNESLYVGEVIPNKKLTNVISVFPIPKDEQVLALIDATVFGSCKEGLAICQNGMYVRNDWSASTRKGFISWEEFKRADISLLDKYEVEVTPGFTINLAGSDMECQLLIEIFSNIQSYLVNKDHSPVSNSYNITPPVIEPQSKDEQWMVAIEGEQFGPYSTEKVKNMIESRHVKSESSYVWKQGMEQWEIINTLPEFQQKQFSPVPPPPPDSVRSYQLNGNRLTDLNEATIEDLLILPGIDMSTAQAFTEERKRRGGFNHYAEIRELLGLQPHEFEKVRQMTTLISLSQSSMSGRVIDF